MVRESQQKYFASNRGTTEQEASTQLDQAMDGQLQESGRDENNALTVKAEEPDLPTSITTTPVEFSQKVPFITPPSNQRLLDVESTDDEYSTEEENHLREVKKFQMNYQRRIYQGVSHEKSLAIGVRALLSSPKMISAINNYPAKRHKLKRTFEQLSESIKSYQQTVGDYYESYDSQPSTSWAVHTVSSPDSGHLSMNSTTVSGNTASLPELSSEDVNKVILFDTSVQNNPNLKQYQWIESPSLNRVSAYNEDSEINTLRTVDGIRTPSPGFFQKEGKPIPSEHFNLCPYDDIPGIHHWFVVNELMDQNDYPSTIRNSKELVLRRGESSFVTTKMGFNKYGIFLGSNNGVIRQFRPTTLAIQGKDLVLPEPEEIIDIYPYSMSNMLIVLTGTHVWGFDQKIWTNFHLNTGLWFVKIFRTWIGTFIIGRDGALFEIECLDSDVNLHKVLPLTSGIETATMISSDKLYPKMGVLLAVSICRKIGIYRIIRGDNNKLKAYLLCEFPLMRLTHTIALAASETYLFATTLSDMFNNSRDEKVPISMTKWSTILRKEPEQWLYELPGYYVNSIECENGFLTVVLDGNVVVIYNTKNEFLEKFSLLLDFFIRKVKYIERKGTSLEQILVYVNYDDRIATRKLPTQSKVCGAEQCREHFKKQRVSGVTVCCCRHYFDNSTQSFIK